MPLVWCAGPSTALCPLHPSGGGGGSSGGSWDSPVATTRHWASRSQATAQPQNVDGGAGRRLSADPVDGDEYYAEPTLPLAAPGLPTAGNDVLDEIPVEPQEVAVAPFYDRCLAVVRAAPALERAEMESAGFFVGRNCRVSTVAEGAHVLISFATTVSVPDVVTLSRVASFLASYHAQALPLQPRQMSLLRTRFTALPALAKINMPWDHFTIVTSARLFDDCFMVVQMKVLRVRTRGLSPMSSPEFVGQPKGRKSKSRSMLAGARGTAAAASDDTVANGGHVYRIQPAP